MDNQSIYERFQPGVVPSNVEEGEKAYYFIFYGNELLVELLGKEITIPCFASLEKIEMEVDAQHYLGKLDGYSCYGVGVKSNSSPLEGYAFQDLRTLLMGGLDEEIFLLAGRALQIINWGQTHRYCGRCGSLTQPKEGQRAKLCPDCGLISYPRIAPAIIVAVMKDDQLLLAHNRNFPYNFYSILAGFVEAGETFEDCIRREVQEEAGIQVKNIKYFGSQPWPFPHSLMVGFTADYAGGEIVIDETELDKADWFSVDNLPPLPAQGSIARRLIDWFIEKYSKE